MLRCEGLYKSFGGVEALVDVSFQPPESGITAIIGPNGAGKTTLINILTGFLESDEGRVCLGERNLTGLPPHTVAELGVARTFQDLRLIRETSVLDNVLLACPDQKGETLAGALFRRGVSWQERQNREKATDLLEFIGLAEESRSLAGALSYGQQKLLSLACCLASEPSTLLLDEPVSGVDPKTIPVILDRLQSIQAEDRRVVFIEHDIEAVRQIADAVVVMDHGKIVARGASEEVLDRSEIMEVYLA